MPSPLYFQIPQKPFRFDSQSFCEMTEDVNVAEHWKWMLDSYKIGVFRWKLCVACVFCCYGTQCWNSAMFLKRYHDAGSLTSNAFNIKDSVAYDLLPQYMGCTCFVDALFSMWAWYLEVTFEGALQTLLLLEPPRITTRHTTFGQGRL